MSYLKELRVIVTTLVVVVKVVKSSPYLSRHQTIKMYEVEIQLHTLTLAPDEGDH
jgi:hypothetical protein